MSAEQADSDFQAQLRDHLSHRGRLAANSRWARLEPIKKMAVEIWLGKRWTSRAEAIRSMRTLILESAMEAGVPLSPDNISNTIEVWLKKHKKPELTR